MFTKKLFIINILTFSVLAKFDSNWVNDTVINTFKTLTSSGLHIHYIIELNNPINSLISELAQKNQIPCTIHNIYPKHKKLIGYNYWVKSAKYRNLTFFKPTNINKIVLKYNSYSSIISIVLPQFESLYPIPPREDVNLGADKNYDFDVIVPLQRLFLLKDLILCDPKLTYECNVYILLKTQFTVFQFGRRKPRNQREFNSIIGFYRPERISSFRNLETFANYYLINVGKSDVVEIIFLCLYCDKFIIIAINIDIFVIMLTGLNINNFIYKNHPSKIIYSKTLYNWRYKTKNLCSEPFIKDISIEIYCIESKNISLLLNDNVDQALWKLQIISYPESMREHSDR